MVSVAENTRAKAVAVSLFSGGFAGGTARTCIAPLERVKIIFQTSELQFTFKGAWRILMDTYSKEGVRSLWRGNGAEMVRILPYAAIQFTSHEHYKNTLLYEGETDLPPLRRFLAGSMAGATAVACTYPLDLMRARLAVQHKGAERYRGLLDAFRTILKRDGGNALFRGLPVTLLGIMPYAGIAFSTFETLKKDQLKRKGTRDLSLHERMAFGAVAGLMGQSATYPLDIVRRRMQTDGFLNDRPKRGIFETARVVCETQGLVRGLYKGLSMNFIKGPIAVAISFTTFDTLKQFWKSQGLQIEMIR